MSDDGFVRPTEFDRAITSLGENIDLLRSDIKSLREDIHEILVNGREEAREEGLLAGRVKALEERRTSSEAWKLATIAPGLVALILMMIEWIRGK